MTKREAIATFKADIMPAVVKHYSARDKVALQQAWNDWTDALCKDGRITLKQYESWDNPF